MNSIKGKENEKDNNSSSEELKLISNEAQLLDSDDGVEHILHIKKIKCY